MTTALFSMLHPTFEALSAYADLPALDAAKSRIGRHVSRCADCRPVVEEIRQLGEQARAASVERAPDELWVRIADAVAIAAAEPTRPRETPPPAAITWEPAPSMKPTRSWPVPARKRVQIGVAIALAAAVAVLSVIVWPGGQSLQATGLSRLTYSPTRPIPGGTLTVRYRPGTWLKGAPRLVLVGAYSQAAGHNPIAWWGRQRLGDSLATLRPMSDGSYEARVRLPTDFLALQLAVSDSTGTDGDSDGSYLWGVIAGEPSGAPSLRALLAAEESFAHNSWGEGSGRRNPRINVADSLKRYFPAHPAGWAYATDYGTQKGVFSYLRFFQSAERRYLNLYEKLAPLASLDAERLHDMVSFAFRIEEPAQAQMWAMRLVHEHPEDPRAIYDLARALHSVELRGPKGLADSIRPWLPLLDSLYLRSPQVDLTNSDVAPLVRRYGDPATQALWQSRFVASLGVRYTFDVRTDSGIRALTPALVQQLQTTAATRCDRPEDKFRLFGTAWPETRWCIWGKSNAFRTLSHIALLHGDPRGALVLADSSLAAWHVGVGCAGAWDPSLRIRARAHLTLGDTLAAEQDLAAGVPPDDHLTAYTDLARRMLGRRFDEGRWAGELAASRSALAACVRQNKAVSDSLAAKRRERAQL